jgi:hypothetical protein
MSKLALALAIVTTAGVLQVPLVFATVPVGCTGNPHDRDSGLTGNPHDPSRTTSSGFEIGNPHDNLPRHHETHRITGDICPGS